MWIREQIKPYKSVFLSFYMHIGAVQGRALICVVLSVSTSAYMHTNAQMVPAIALPGLPAAPKLAHPSVRTARITQVVLPRGFLSQSPSREWGKPRRIISACASSKGYVPWQHRKESGGKGSHPLQL